MWAWAKLPSGDADAVVYVGAMVSYLRKNPTPGVDHAQVWPDAVVRTSIRDAG